MVRPRGTPSTGRHRIEMALRPDKSSRQVTFSKRRAEIFTKCSELALLCSARVAVAVFSEAGNMFSLGFPSVDAILSDTAHDDDGDREALEETRRAREAAAGQVAAETTRMDSIGDKVVKARRAGGKFWWEADVEVLGEAELPEFARALARLRDNVRRHAYKMPAPAPAAVAHAGDAASEYLAY